MGIATFESYHRYSDLDFHARKHPSSTKDGTMPTGTVAVGPAVQARVDHGRWIADCPEPGCQGAEFVSFDNPVFFCCECRNAGFGHDLLPVLVPALAMREQIEALLVARPAPAIRNWMPGETVAKLRAENKAHGVAV